MEEIVTKSVDETKEFARTFAVLKPHHKPLIIALNGDLGAGKTAFVQGFAEGLKITDKIISPTFVLIRQHKVPNTDQTLHHIDLYRLEENTDIKTLGVEDLLKNQNNIVLIEWADKIKDHLPNNTIYISIEKLNENHRKITIQ